MDIKNLYKYYSFGYNYSNLFRGKHGTKIKNVIESINKFLDFIDEHDLKVTKKAIFVDLTKIKKELKKLDSDSTITSSESSRLSEKIHSIDKTLDSELKLREAYILTEKRIGLDRLLNNIESIFAKNVYSKLPNIAKYDFSEAGKCIAFERPTAAAFHVLRGTEDVLKYYYNFIIRRKRLEKPMWGPMVNQLKERKNTPKPLLNNLDNIRINFRNPTTHPTSKYTLDEVQDLFNLCIDVVNRMIRYIEKKGN